MVDTIVGATAWVGMHVAIITMWGPNAGKPGEAFLTDPEVHNTEYGHALGQCYRDTPHVIWVASGEYHHISSDRQPPNSTELMYLRRIAEGLNDGSGGTHLITLHPGSPRSSSMHWHRSTWLSFNVIQTLGCEWGSTDLVCQDYGLSPMKPVVNGKPGYEGRHPHLPQRGIMDAWHLRLEACCSPFSGAFGYTYGHVTIWLRYGDRKGNRLGALSRRRGRRVDEAHAGAHGIETDPREPGRGNDWVLVLDTSMR